MKQKLNNISHIIDQISQLDNLIMLHQKQNDRIMANQYQSRKYELLEDLLAELIKLDAGSPRLNEMIKALIQKVSATKPEINDREISKQFKFSLADLEALTTR